MKISPSVITAWLVAPTAVLFSQQPNAASQAFPTLASFTMESPGPDPHVSPDGRFVLLGRGTRLQVYEVDTKRTRTIAEARGISWLEWAPRGNRVAWAQLGDDGRTSYVWSMPVDPKTAMPTGPAQRVTVGPSHEPSISESGKWLAFGSPDSLGPSTQAAFRGARLSVVPITGGPERVIARFKGGFEVARWSPDDKSIYVGGTVVGEKEAVVTRVHLDGRKPEIIRAGNSEWFTGMTSDRRHIVLVPAKAQMGPADRAIVIDTTGKEIGRAPLPEGVVTQYDDVLADSALVWVTFSSRRSLEIAAMNGSNRRRISLVGESNDAPVWSPDGKHIAFQVREGHRVLLALMSADGSGLRVFRETPIRREPLGIRWSPDSRYLGFMTGDLQRLSFLDVAANSTRTIMADTGVRVGNWTWSADSRSVVAVILGAPTTRASIDRISLTGSRQKLADGSSVPGRNPVYFVGDSAVYLRTDSAAYLVSLRGAPARRLHALTPNTFAGFPVVSPDRQWVAAPFADARRPDAQQLELTSLVTGERRLIEVPFRFAADPRFTPDGRAVVAVGWSSDSTGTALYVVPLNGGSPRVVPSVISPARTGFSVSPDGSSVAYSAVENETRSLLVVPLRPALPRASTASSRP